ncbi:hypothetical protein DENIS_2679 [Desulfonema ishimotonii]|uniref:Uncharacterized protein n=1 Tax=Desulfonema ishimotonii TaxID=45657 RepID=A0A401FXL2_9BACT|nr:hypothetical protein [Desulfonema ishimotonii]GBC61717.1 hypothetical protein DENIS_2679 [Desulfonema ishimotonii]
MTNKKVETVMQQTRTDLKKAQTKLPMLKNRLAESMAFAALGEDNHTQVARIKREISNIEEVILNAPMILRGLRQISALKTE